MVRIGEQTHRALRELARAEHQSMLVVLDKAVEEYRRTRFFEEVNTAYAALRSDPEAWEEIQAERAAWEGMPDGLPEGGAWPEGERSSTSRKKTG